MYTKKNLPTSQFELSTGKADKRFGRDNDIRRDGDTLKELSIGLFDVDHTIKWYFDNVIKPQIDDFGTTLKVPVMFGAPEKWKNVQADGYFRDVQGKIQSPLISYRRSAIEKDKTLGSKVDANFPQLYYTQELKYGQQNKYDQFSVLTNSKPVKSYVTTVIPEFVNVTYEVIIWTDFVEHMNGIVESILYSEGSFWGEPDRFRFRTKVDSYTNTTDLLQDQDRVVRTSFTLTLFGYIIPDVLVKNLSKKQAGLVHDARQVIIEADTDANPGIFNTEEAERKSGANVTYTTPQYRVNAITQTIDDMTLTYLNTNQAVENPTINIPDTVIFNGDFLAAPSGLPATSVINFTFFINGTYIEPSAITSFTNSTPGACTLVLDIAQLGFTLSPTDELVAIGKFT